MQKDSSPSSEVAQDPLRDASRVTLALAQELARCAGSSGRACVAVEPSAEGVLTAVGAAYLAHVPPEAMRLVRRDALQPRLDEEVFPCETDATFALRVNAGLERSLRRGCRRTSSPDRCPSCRRRCTRFLAYVAASDQEDMPEVAHRFLRQAFRHRHQVFFRNSDPWMARAEELATATSQECERARQFVRFSRLEDGSFLAVHRPNADVVPLVAGHFKRRMGTERFALIDPVHGHLALHAEGRLTLVSLPPEQAEALGDAARWAPDEPYVRALWKRFYDALELPGRQKDQRGYDLRGRFMPQRLWEGLPELDPRTDTAWSFVPAPYRGRPDEPLLGGRADALNAKGTKPLPGAGASPR